MVKGKNVTYVPPDTGRQAVSLAKKKSNENDVKLINETKETKPLFRIDLSHSMIGSQRFFYKDVEINSLSIEALNNLKKDLDFILREIDKEIDKLLV